MKNVILLLVTLTVLVAFYFFGRGIWFPMYAQMIGKRTVADVVEEYGVSAEDKLTHAFVSAGVYFPPQEIALLAIKEDKILELWARQGERWSLKIIRY